MEVSSELTLHQKIENVAREICPEFAIETDFDKAMYNSMVLYFNKSENSPWDVKKGLLIMGDVGTGKTICMRVMAKIYKSFRMVETRHITRDAISKPQRIVDMYGRMSFKLTPGGSAVREMPYNYCFDDLGLEPTTISNYGNKIPVMSEILLDRYKMFVESGMITHCTTNLSADNLGEVYGSRIKDRLRQMMNVIVFEGNSKRK